MAKEERKLGEPRMDYQEQLRHNEWVFLNSLKQVRPDLWVLADVMDSLRLNYLVLLKVLRHMANIGSGSKYGTITIEIQDGVVTFVRGTEADKLNEPIFLPDKKE